MATRNHPTPFRIQKFLGGLRYPAQKPEILDCARQKGADEQILQALVRLPERQYDSPISLSCEIFGSRA